MYNIQEVFTASVDTTLYYKVFMNVWKHTHIYIYTHTLTHIYIHTHTHSHTHIYAHTHTLSHTHTHTHTHTHICRHVRTDVELPWKQQFL